MDDAQTICNEVPVSVTGRYYADYDGNWQTNSHYSTNRSIFVLEFTGSEVTNDQYKRTMTNFNNKLNVLGTKFASRSLFYNTMILATFGFGDYDTKMEFYSSADAGVIFNQIVYSTAVSSKVGICQPFDRIGKELTAHFDEATKSMVIDYPIYVDPDALTIDYMSMDRNSSDWKKHVLAHSTCPDQERHSPPLLNSIYAEYQNGRIAYSFDMRSAMLAISFNNGISDPADYEELYLDKTDPFALVGYVGYVDSFYTDPPMSPV